MWDKLQRICGLYQNILVLHTPGRCSRTPKADCTTFNKSRLLPRVEERVDRKFLPQEASIRIRNGIEVRTHRELKRINDSSCPFVDNTQAAV